MSMFFDIFAALLAWGAAAAWVLTGGDKLPPDWDHLRTGGADKLFDSGDLSVSSNIFLTPEKPQFLGSRRPHGARVKCHDGRRHESQV
jgi:hypothetical protein